MSMTPSPSLSARKSESSPLEHNEGLIWAGRRQAGFGCHEGENCLSFASAAIERYDKTRMVDEIELKLELAPDDADKLEASALLHGAPETVEQRSVYFDTPHLALSKKGLSLRIRCTGETCTQTVKADGASAAGLYARSEWERPVEGDVPIFDHSTPLRMLLGDGIDSISPVFEVRVERRTWIIKDGGTTIELVMDRGEVLAGDRQSLICEAELELKRGDPSKLFVLARRLDAAVPIRIGVLTKAERGYRRAEPVAEASKASRVALTGDMTAAESFRLIAQACVRQYRLNEATLLVGRNAEALHQARVALRRLRSAFAIFKPVISSNGGTAINAELRWLACEFGDARNLDVLLGLSRQGSLHDTIKTAREKAYDRIDTDLRSPRVRAVMLDLAEWIAMGDWLRAPDTEEARQKPVREFAHRALDRFHRKVKKKGRDFAQTDDEARHRLRKDAKKLRYAAEFFSSLFAEKRERRRIKKFIAALEELQDKLGELNDLATAPQVLARLGLLDDPGAFDLLGKAKKEMLLEAAADAYDDLMNVKRFWR